MNLIGRSIKQAQVWKKAAQPSIDKEGSTRVSSNSWKARRQRRVFSTKKREEKALEDTTKQKEKSLLANKVFEYLKAMLDAYEARFKPNQINEERSTF